MPQNFNVSPYFDDFDELKKFVRILFRPGFAVQARELTQSQTILQNQIERLGEYFFDEGSEVVNGQTQLDPEYAYVKLASIGGTTVATMRAWIQGKTVIATGQTTGLVAQIVNIVDIENADPVTYYVKYKDSGASGSVKSFNNGELLTVQVFDTDSYIADALPTPEYTITSTVAASAATGFGYAASIKNGTRFVNGLFIEVDEQTHIVSKYTNNPTVKIGLRIVEDLVTPEQDPSLLDNAQGSVNYSAPGAHRYKVRLVLDTDGDIDPENFIEIVSLDEGKLLKDYRQTQASNAGVERQLAKRTYDANGNFTVEAFKVQVREHLNDGTNGGIYLITEGGDDTKLGLDVDSGRAYVNGFEVSTTGAEVIVLDKALDSNTYNNALIGAGYGAYVIVDNLVNLPNITSYPTVQLRDGLAIQIGTARIRNIELHSKGANIDSTTKWRIYLFDIKLNSGKVFDNVATLYSGGGIQANVTGTANKLINRTDSMPIEPLPFSVITSASDVSYDVRRQITLTFATSAYTFAPASGEQLREKTLQNYILMNKNTNTIYNIYDTAGVFEITGNTIVINLAAIGVTISSSTPMELFYTVNKNDATSERKTKLKSTTIDTFSSPPFTTLMLTKYDIIKINSIMDGATDITDRYTLDDGQRDGYYGSGYITLKPDATAPASVTVSYDHYNHTSGDYFTVESYPLLDRKDIKYYESSFGDLINLYDSMDFRTVLDGTQSGNDIFIPQTSIRADVTYLMPRIDKVSVDETGNFIVTKGTPALNPVPPKSPNSGMEIIEVYIPAGSFADTVDNVQLEYIENKRYTMRDIGKLESRIENLEYYTKLNSTEQALNQKNYLDSNGDAKFKNGFFVDTFSGHGNGDVENPDYECSIDQAKGELRPEVSAEGVELELDPSSSGYQITGDLLTLPYSTKTFIDQPLASGYEYLNPFEMKTWTGIVELTPSSDTWISTKTKPALVVNRENELDVIKKAPSGKKAFRSMFNHWQNVWAGQPRSVFGVFRDVNTSSNGLTTFNRTKIVPRVTREEVNDRLVDVSFVPYLKPRDIQFESKMMKPNTVVYPFFDGVDVSDYVTPEGGILGGQLKTDAQGRIAGTFSIPDVNIIKFRTGVREFKLIDSPTNNIAQATTVSTTTYNAKGSTEVKQSTVTSTRPVRPIINFIEAWRKLLNISTPSTSSGNQNLVSMGEAQTFVVNEPKGVFVTSMNIYFRTKDKTLPVMVQMVEVINGVPTKNVIPFSTVVLNPVDVLTSLNASVPTMITFPSPVYLREGTEYAFMFSTTSKYYSVFTAQMGRRDSLTKKIISKQPNAGTLFRTSNTTTWSADKLRDIKFNMDKAVFNTGTTANLVFKNKDLAMEGLEENPFFITNVADTMKVYHEEHGMNVGSYVEFSGGGLQNNMQTDGVWQITSVVDNDVYVCTRSGAGIGASTGRYGGTSVMASKDVPMDLAQAIIQEMAVSGTTTKWSIRTTNSKSINGAATQVAYTIDSAFVDFDLNDNFVFSSPKKIASTVNEVNQPNMNGEKSVVIMGELKSSNSNVSPAIDMERVTIVAVGNRTSYPSDILAELQPFVSGSENSADIRYIRKPVSLELPANSVEVQLEAHRQSGSDIKVYVKTLGADVDAPFENQPWVEVPVITYGKTNASREEFSEYIFRIENVPEFNLFSVKVVMLSDNSALPPRVRELKAVALTA